MVIEMTLGTQLKNARNTNQLSLKDVKELCGIADSKLSRVERGGKEKLRPDELKKLADLYDLNIVELYILAGYLAEEDLTQYQLVFENTSLLTDEEKQSIQTQINLFAKRRGQINDF